MIAMTEDHYDQWLIKLGWLENKNNWLIIDFYPAIQAKAL